MNYCGTLTIVVIGLTLSTPISFGQTTPLDFAQRRDVGREIQLQPNQLAAIRALGPVCDAQCQAYVRENFDEISDDARLAFAALPQAQQEQVISNQESAVREEVEMNVIDDVLADPQMDRFRELRTQFQGPSGLTTPAISEALGLSEGQLGELQDLQIGAQELTNACLGNSSLTGDQQATIIQNINNGVIDQSINILENAQLDIFVGLCGEACDFDPEEDVPGDDEGDPGAEPTDIADDGAQNDNPVDPENEVTPTPAALQAGSNSRNPVATPSRNAAGSNTRNSTNAVRANRSTARGVTRQAGSSSRNSATSRSRSTAGSSSRNRATSRSRSTAGSSSRNSATSRSRGTPGRSTSRGGSSRR